MVEQIHHTGLQRPSHLGLGQTGQAEQVTLVETDSAAKKQNQTEAAGYNDIAEVSQEALEKAQADLKAQRFARVAGRLPESFDTDKVNQFKSLLKNGQIGSYLGSLDTRSIADAILAGPSGGLFSR